ncbi:replicative DNA helicase, partial [Candidatus Bipolaricaulota bacterium]|nr:replicative DNA helicase [Candidatus Bipolaricaulota bacterium]
YYDRPEEEASKKGQGIVSKTEIIIAKQRNGPLGKITLAFHKAYASFYSSSWSEGPPS